MRRVTACERCGEVTGTNDLVDGECVSCRADPDGCDPRKAMLEYADEHDLGGDAGEC